MILVHVQLHIIELLGGTAMSPEDLLESLETALETGELDISDVQQILADYNNAK